MLLRGNCKNYKNVKCLTKVRHHTCMHPACMHVNTCTYTPTHINIDPTKSIHSRVHKFMVMAETSTFGILHGRNVCVYLKLEKKRRLVIEETNILEFKRILGKTLIKRFSRGSVPANSYDHGGCHAQGPVQFYIMT